MSTDTSPVEHSDRWILHLRGRRVARVSIDPRLELSLDSGWEAAMGTTALLSRGSARTNPALPLIGASRNTALHLLGASVLSAVAFKSGALRIVFDTGLHLTCPPGNSPATWEITGSQGWRFTSLPGGGLRVSPGSGFVAPGRAGVQ